MDAKSLLDTLTPDRTSGDAGEPGEPDQHARPTTDLPINRVLDLISNRRRRIAIRIVAGLDEGEVLAEKDLSRRVAAVEQSKPPEQVRSKPYKSVYTSLHQTHLENLESAHVVNWRARKVVKGDEAEAIATVLGVIEGLCAEYEEEDQLTPQSVEAVAQEATPGK